MKHDILTKPKGRGTKDANWRERERPEVLLAGLAIGKLEKGIHQGIRGGEKRGGGRQREEEKREGTPGNGSVSPSSIFLMIAAVKGQSS